MSAYYQSRSIGDLGAGRAASFRVHRPTTPFNRGALRGWAGRIEQPPKRQVGEPTLTKVYDFMTVNGAKGITKTRKSKFNKGALTARRHHTEAAPQRRTIHDADEAFDNHFNVHDDADDKIQVPASLIDKVEKLEQMGYEEDFVHDFIKKLQFKSRGRLSSEQASIYDDLMTDLRKEKKRSAPTEAKVQDNAVKDAIRNIIKSNAKLSDSDVSETEADLSDTSEEEEEEKSDGIPTLVRQQYFDVKGESAFNSLFITLHTRAVNQFTGIDQKWNGGKTKFIYGFKGGLIEVKAVKQAIKTGKAFLNTKTLRLEKD